MREAGLIVAGALKLAEETIKPDLLTIELDKKLTEYVLDKKGEMAFKGYRGYPANVCISINEELVHGIPGQRKIKEGDIVSIDVGVKYKNYYADAAITVGVGKISDIAKKLLDTTKEVLDLSIEKIKPGVHMYDICGFIQDFVESRKFSVVRQYVGHGIGSQLHEDPQIPNYRVSPEEQTDIILKPGIVLAIEPMVNEGVYNVKTLPDNWTVVTSDGKLSAHFEHTIAVTEQGYKILTEE